MPGANDARHCGTRVRHTFGIWSALFRRKPHHIVKERADALGFAFRGFWTTLRLITVQMATKPRRVRSVPRIPKLRRQPAGGVSRAEFHRVIDLLNRRGEILSDYGMRIDRLTSELAVQ